MCVQQRGEGIIEDREWQVYIEDILNRVIREGSMNVFKQILERTHCSWVLPKNQPSITLQTETSLTCEIRRLLEQNLRQPHCYLCHLLALPCSVPARNTIPFKTTVLIGIYTSEKR